MGLTLGRAWGREFPTRSKTSPLNFGHRGPEASPLAKAVRSPDWIKLSYENQRAGQRMVYFRTANQGCQVKFTVPGDSVYSEGSNLALEGVADCASSFWWSQVSGVPLRILDPDVKSLQTGLPRVGKDTSLQLRFSARFGDSISTRDVLVRITNSIPEPEFTLPSQMDWNGSDSLIIRPVITNLEAIKSSSHPAIRYTWEVDSAGVDTAWMESALILRSSASAGPVKVTLCLDNQAEPVCKNHGSDHRQVGGSRTPGWRGSACPNWHQPVRLRQPRRRTLRLRPPGPRSQGCQRPHIPSKPPTLGGSLPRGPPRKVYL